MVKLMIAGTQRHAFTRLRIAELSEVFELPD
jgi:hypothetical protein